MNVLVIGQGGREHAIIKGLKSSPSVDAIHALPGADGFLECEGNHALSPSAENILGVVSACSIDLVVIGPEAPLVDGVADELRAKGVLVFGPDKAAAELEGSKVFCKEFLNEFNIPTAQSCTVASRDEAMAKAQSMDAPYVLKMDGLAGGKGVFICDSLDELSVAANKAFAGNESSALLEEYLEGQEVSYLIMVSGNKFEPLPLAQDHKRIFENDEGPNTGGMGVVGPIKLTDSELDTINSDIVMPTLKGMKVRGWDYRGVLFIGLMLTSKGPKVLEFNIRFGDPETQVIIPLFNGDWGEALLSASQGQLIPMGWKKDFAACVVLAAENYPESPVKGDVIESNLESDEKGYFIHAGTVKREGQWVTNGGRVLGAMGLARSMAEAIDNAYFTAGRAPWRGRQIRKDIGQKVLSKK